MSGLTRLALRLTDFSERFIPSAFVIACLLTFVTFALAMASGSGPAACLSYWGDGFWALLEFGMQMSLMMVTGSVLADSPAVRRGLDALAKVPRTPRQTVVWMAFVSLALCWVHWALGMIAGAFLLRRMAARHPKTDYRLLVAVAYWGMGAIWHAGLSGSAPLLVATPKHFMEASIGVLPLSATIFSPFNLGMIAATVGCLLALAWVLYPPQGQAFTLDAEALAALEEKPRVEKLKPASAFIAWTERSWLINGAVGLMGLAWLAQDASAHGLGLTFNKINLLFLAASLLLYPDPAAFTRSCEKAAGYAAGIIVQFPLYAGVYGIIKGSGLDARIGAWFVSLATAKTYPLVVYWYSGALNYFVPSGGSKWAIEAPYILEAAKTLGVPYPKVVLAYAWGDMLTDMIQPFWCLPLLAIAKLEFKDILGYEMITFAACGLIGSVGFLLF